MALVLRIALDLVPEERGGRIVARARPLERLEDGEPQPLRDLRAAKRRPLRAAP